MTKPRSMAQEIAELRELDTPRLVARYTELFGRPPRSRNREHLWKRCAWKLQEARLGGLSETAKRRLEELIGELDLPLPAPERTGKGALRGLRLPEGLTPGTTLLRRWRDRELEVLVREGGFEWEGALYRSLSAVARAITGSHWNGRLFFGLTERRKR